jgi:hypothetical protein
VQAFLIFRFNVDFFKGVVKGKGVILWQLLWKEDQLFLEGKQQPA